MLIAVRIDRSYRAGHEGDMPKPPLEKTLYPVVERWVRRHFGCFQTAINKGLRHSRIDVVGVRDTGGDLSGEIEVIAVEVKRGSFPFANGCGQTLGYNVYANRVYLADLRDEPFSTDEVQIASHLGIGLVQIRSGRCIEVISSPVYKPIRRLNLRLLETLHLGKCQLCDSIFNIGDSGAGANRFSSLTRENVRKAIAAEKGLMFWNREVAERKHKMGMRVSADGTTYERRFICPDCVSYVIAQIAPAKR
ncbi:MAG: hypothetical protein HY775_00900 [Acidobacteria bacterium]|nr:hypothetical protein [Acidobacteriota bacterium]